MKITTQFEPDSSSRLKPTPPQGAVSQCFTELQRLLPRGIGWWASVTWDEIAPDDSINISLQVPNVYVLCTQRSPASLTANFGAGAEYALFHPSVLERQVRYQDRQLGSTIPTRSGPMGFFHESNVKNGVMEGMGYDTDWRSSRKTWQSCNPSSGSLGLLCCISHVQLEVNPKPSRYHIHVYETSARAKASQVPGPGTYYYRATARPPSNFFDCNSDLKEVMFCL